MGEQLGWGLPRAVVIPRTLPGPSSHPTPLQGGLCLPVWDKAGQGGDPHLGTPATPLHPALPASPAAHSPSSCGCQLPPPAPPRSSAAAMFRLEDNVLEIIALIKKG